MLGLSLAFPAQAQTPPTARQAEESPVTIIALGGLDYSSLSAAAARSCPAPILQRDIGFGDPDTIAGVIDRIDRKAFEEDIKAFQEAPGQEQVRANAQSAMGAMLVRSIVLGQSDQVPILLKQARDLKLPGFDGGRRVRFLRHVNWTAADKLMPVGGLGVGDRSSTLFLIHDPSNAVTPRLIWQDRVEPLGLAAQPDRAAARDATLLRPVAADLVLVAADKFTPEALDVPNNATVTADRAQFLSAFHAMLACRINLKDPIATFVLARLALEGLGTPQDASHARRLLEAAAAPSAERVTRRPLVYMASAPLGMSLGRRVDDQSAKPLGPPEPNPGYYPAMLLLGDMANQGIGSPPDPDGALEWYARAWAATQGAAVFHVPAAFAAQLRNVP